MIELHFINQWRDLFDLDLISIGYSSAAGRTAVHLIVLGFGVHIEWT